METYQGDLTDIIRAGAGAEAISGEPDWKFSTEPMSTDMFRPVSTTPLDGFGNPFSNLQDPLLHSGSSSTPGALLPTTGRFLGVGGHVLASKIFDDDSMKLPRFSQISTLGCAGKLPASPCGSPVVGGGASVANSSNSSGQITSPRKRRKSEAKKVVCIPAPPAAAASANSRPTGEIVPSDLWAWRKYGQKPIKGSPHPRGYYRCSSSKGCPARKQVERSRTDLNMLVITYTSEHNHPWPTQRNALAGSTRAHPSNNTSANNSNNKMATAKEDQNDVKEDMEKQLQVEENRFSTDHGFPYRPTMSEQDNFFTDLDEMDTDPMYMLFTQGFSGDHMNHNDHSSETKDQTYWGCPDD